MSNELSEAERCPGCGSVIPSDPKRQTCHPLGVDTSLPGYAYLEGRWGYCYILQRDVRPEEAAHWQSLVFAERDTELRAQIAKKIRYLKTGDPWALSRAIDATIEIAAETAEGRQR